MMKTSMTSTTGLTIKTSRTQHPMPSNSRAKTVTTMIWTETCPRLEELSLSTIWKAMGVLEERWNQALRRVCQLMGIRKWKKRLKVSIPTLHFSTLIWKLTNRLPRKTTNLSASLWKSTPLRMTSTRLKSQTLMTMPSNKLKTDRSSIPNLPKSNRPLSPNWWWSENQQALSQQESCFKWLDRPKS